MNELATKLLRLKTPMKFAVTAAALLAVLGIYYVTYYVDLSESIDQAKNAQRTLADERTSYEKRKKEYVAYRDELRKLQEEQRELLKALPKKAEIPSFISAIQEQVELAGLEHLALNIEQEVPEELYVKIPVRMELRGSYHGVAKFFKNVSEMRRIVNIENLILNVDRQANDPDGAPKLKARFVAATFRYQDPKGGTP